MKYIGENAITKLISLIKGDLATKQPTITASGLLKGDGAGTVTAADTQEATLVDVPNGLLKGDGTTISAAVAEIDYMVPPFKPEGKSYLTFSSTNSFTLKVNDTTKHWDGTLEYFDSDKTWTVWDGTTTLSAVDNDGEYVLYLRGTGNTVITGGSHNYKWVLTGTDITCIGNIENLLDYATVETGAHPTMANYCYFGMFDGCTHLTQAPALPATTLTSNCYRYMFYGCTSLIQAPALPATTLASDCYSNMFYGCTSLTQAPALPATTLKPSCYEYMFYNCTSLIQAPALPATTLAEGCYFQMFYGCTSLTQAPALPATTLDTSCYQSMFYGCTSLIQAPALPATTLADYCYFEMFHGCTSLKLSSSKTDEYTHEYRIPSSGTGTTATDARTDMFTSTGGTFTGTPSINTTYYLSSDNMVVYDTEVATLREYVGSMIDSNSDVFIATYGTTTSAEIEAAYQAGKAIIAIHPNKVIQYHIFQRTNETDHNFSTFALNGKVFTIRCFNDVWSDGQNRGVKPSTHASTHASGGSDPITPASIGAATMEEVNSAIQAAIGNAIGGSY